MFNTRSQFYLTKSYLNNKLRTYTLNTTFKRLFSVIGLDMGGSNTVIAVMEPNGPRVIENAEGLRTTPSYLTISDDNTEFVGVASKRISIVNKYNTFYGTKFFFGQKFSDDFVQKLIKKFPFKIAAGPNDEVYFLTKQNVHFTPTTATMPYLKYVKEQSEALTGKPLKKIVMALPSFIKEEGKTEIKSCFKECGMDIVSFIPEAKAAAYAYNLDKNEKVNRALVFNFGGINFSLSLIEKNIIDPNVEADKEKELFHIKNEAYDYNLGGDDIDQILINYLLNEFKRTNKVDISEDLNALQRIKEAADKAKVELSLSQAAEISLPFLYANETGPMHLNIRISRAKFETLIDPLITKLRQNCEEFLKTNQIKKEEIDEIILLGGVGRIPRVQEIIKLVFAKEANKTINPEEAAAIGASIIAGSIKLNFEEIKQMDILPLSIGVETLGGSFVRLIKKDTPLPCKITKVFTTVYDNQPKIDLKFYLGEREIASENKLIGGVNMSIPLQNKGETKIKVTFTLNNKGDLNINAVEQLSKKATGYTTRIYTGLTQEIIEDVIEVSQKLKEDDMVKKDLIKLKVEADGFVYELLKEISKEESNLNSESLKESLNSLNENLLTEDYEKILASYQNLQKIYSEAEKSNSSQSQ